MAKPNTVRGEVSVAVGKRTYVLKPNHERQVWLDDALECGIMGTLARASQSNVIKVRDAATAIHYLADDAPSVDELMREIFTTGLDAPLSQVFIALANCASGSGPASGNADAPPAQATGSTSEDG